MIILLILSSFYFGQPPCNPAPCFCLFGKQFEKIINWKQNGIEESFHFVKILNYKNERKLNKDKVSYCKIIRYDSLNKRLASYNLLTKGLFSKKNDTLDYSEYKYYKDLLVEISHISLKEKSNISYEINYNDFLQIEEIKMYLGLKLFKQRQFIYDSINGQVSSSWFVNFSNEPYENRYYVYNRDDLLIHVSSSVSDSNTVNIDNAFSFFYDKNNFIGLNKMDGIIYDNYNKVVQENIFVSFADISGRLSNKDEDYIESIRGEIDYIYGDNGLLIEKRYRFKNYEQYNYEKQFSYYKGFFLKKTYNFRGGLLSIEKKVYEGDVRKCLLIYE